MSADDNAAQTANDGSNARRDTLDHINVRDLVEHEEFREIFALAAREGVNGHLMHDLESALISHGYAVGGHDLEYRGLLNRGAGVLIGQTERLADEIEDCEEVIAKLNRTLKEARERRDDLDDRYYELTSKTGHHPLRERWEARAEKAGEDDA